MARDFNHPHAFLSEGEALAVVVESVSENPPPPLVAVSYRAIEASVMGEGEGSGGE